tara:strand:- start:498 stop:1109 length:612 start_codon:yes stop_codon:yes gene_type:complete
MSENISLGGYGLFELNMVLSPFYILSYFFIDSFVNATFIHFFLYLFSLIIALCFGILFKRTLKITAPPGFRTNPICSSFESPWLRELENFIVPSFRPLFFAFTCVYILCSLLSNPTDNVRGMVFFIFLLFVSISDTIVRRRNYCENNTSILWGVLIGSMVAWLCWGAISLLGGKKFLYFSGNDSTVKKCKLDRKKVRFKCTTN